MNNDSQFLVQKIRSEYTERQHTELDALKALDAKVKKPANVFAYTYGSVSAIVMGAGMSLVMTEVGAMIGLASTMVPGIAIGIVGMGMALSTYPIYKNELFLRIGALLRRAKIASSRRLTVGSFSMDADEHTAMLGDEEIRLTNREFNILYKLLSYPKKTFTRQQLMDEFWDADTDTAPRAVDVYMTKLRSKLADCQDFEIKTVHGLGYKAVIK